MNTFDKSILIPVGAHACRSPALTDLFLQFQVNDLLKGSLLMAMLWYLWFDKREREAVRARPQLSAAIGAAVVGIAVARILAHLYPYRPRPFAVPELHWCAGRTYDINVVAPWSAFPSDHVVVWFALATGICFASRRLGVVALLYSTFLAAGRVYIGFHSPTDILAGATIGGGVAYLFNHERIRTTLYQPIEWLQTRLPGWFYAGAFLLTYEIASMFDHVRQLGRAMWRIAM